MPYKVELLTEASKDFHRLDKAIAQRALRKLRWLSENLDSLTPEPLGGELKGLMKLRVGSFRILYTIHKDRNLITVHLIDHRKNIYRKK